MRPILKYDLTLIFWNRWLIRNACTERMDILDMGGAGAWRPCCFPYPYPSTVGNLMQPLVDTNHGFWYSGHMDTTTIEDVPRKQTLSTPVTIRFPVDLHQQLTEYAEAHGRPFTAQVLYWLRNDLEMAQRGEYPKP